MTLVVVKAEDADGEPCLWQRTEADARSLIDAIGADSALGRAEPTRRPKWARWAVVNRTAPPAPRRPVAGWVEYEPGRWVLEAGPLCAAASAAGWELFASGTCSECGETDEYRPIDDGQATTLEAAQLAAEDALREVLTEAAAVLGLRVVPL